MKKTLFICFALVFSIVCGPASIQAQSKVILNTDPPPMAAPTTAVKTSGTASAKYNKFNDTTTSNSKPISLKIGESGWGTLSAGFSSKGNGVTTPDQIVLHLFTAVKDRSFVDKPDATVFADSEKLFDGKAKISDARTNGNEVYTSFEIAISLDDFRKAAKATKFGISIGPSGWIMTKKETAVFDDLLNLLN